MNGFNGVGIALTDLESDILLQTDGSEVSHSSRQSFSQTEEEEADSSQESLIHYPGQFLVFVNSRDNQAESTQVQHFDMTN